MLDLHDRRRAARVACRLPVRLTRGSHVTYGVTEDLSRAGALVRVPLAALDLSPSADLAEVARRLEQRLGEAFAAEFCWQTLGPLVRKVLRVVRVARVDSDAGVVDLGCELRVPFDALETEALGVGLPPLREDVAAATTAPPTLPDPELAAAAAADAARPRGALRRAVLLPPPERRRPPLLAEACRLGEERVLVALGSPQRLGLTLERQDATGLLVAFDARYGSRLGLLLLEGRQPLWSDAVSVQALELQREHDRLLLSLRLAAPLTPASPEHLGLVGA